MVFFITALRALAACLITNAHYTGVYPTDIIANGGLIGDVLFFAVSGYCLYNIKQSFPKWYGKRLIRCYLPVLIITGVYMLTGAYTLDNHNAAWWYVYPTYYHFVASIVVLYIPYYFIMKIDFLRDRLGIIAAIVAVAYALVYVFAFDKTSYAIDNVRSPMIWFLFFESMLLGAWFRQNDERFKNKFSWWMPVLAVVSFAAYFFSKAYLMKQSYFLGYQFVNQIIIFILLFRTFAGIDSKLEKLPTKLKAIISYIAEITLEIYVVQYVIIDGFKHLSFPLNWIVITAYILLAASVLHFICRGILKLIKL